MNNYEQYIHQSRYARWLPDENRRETWEETVDRYIQNVAGPAGVGAGTVRNLRTAILNHDVMPSMRALMTAGPALDRDNVAGYNCAYVAVDDRRVFDEIMYILMCGTGVGFSVERHYIERLPTVADEFFEDGSIEIHIADSRIGWATAFRKLIANLYDGFVPRLDYSTVRPAGARLATFGGRSSGPEPLRDLFNYTINLFKHAKGRKLNELEVHDLICKTASVIVAGGVRRSALISLSNLTSERLRTAKAGAWYHTDPQRALANNSVCYTEKPDIGMFLAEWGNLIESKSGERGLFARYSCDRSLPDRREPGHEWGTNPCSEIVLRSRQFCNLTEVIARPTDDYDQLKRKVEYATILGTIQSSFTDFRYLGKKWKTNCEEERLLGVSITGIMDCPMLYQDDVTIDGVYQAVGTLSERLEGLKNHAIETNKKWAKKLGVQPSAAITCVKPSGTVSQLVGSASGIHPRYASYYIRRVRGDNKDPLTQALIEQGVPHEPDNHAPDTTVFAFPIASPEGSVTIKDLSAIDQLELWKTYDAHWCEHKPSVSIYVKPDEWLQVGAWVYENFDQMSGVSFFPHDDHIYPQAPYEVVDEATYRDLQSKMPPNLVFDINESDDNTTSSQELACAGGACEL